MIPENVWWLESDMLASQNKFKIQMKSFITLNWTKATRYAHMHGKVWPDSDFC